MNYSKGVLCYWIAVGISHLIISRSVFADSLSDQRYRYQEIQQAWNNDQIDTASNLMSTLKEYPLYPYLRYRQILKNLDQETVLTINSFIKRYPTFPQVGMLSSLFINELARRKNWNELLEFSPKEPISIDARCNWYYAKLVSGQEKIAIKSAGEIWLNGTSLPVSCNKLFSAWKAAGKQTEIAMLNRILLAMVAGNGNLVNFLAKQLSSNYQMMSKAVIELQNNPNTIEDFASHFGPTNFTRQATLLAFARRVRGDVESARMMIPNLIKLQKMNKEEAQRLRESVAWRLMNNNVTDKQALWRDNTVMNSNSTPLIESRLRLAIGNGDRDGLKNWIIRLDPVSKVKDEWQYWKADLLLESGYKEKAENILHNLTKSRGFYSMVAAQRLDIKYVPRIDRAPCPDISIDDEPEISRIRELMYWGMNNLACTEWGGLIARKTTAQQSMLAHYALNHCWWNLSVQATIFGKLWNYLVERFPLAWKAQFVRYTNNKEISLSYAMAIARQESAWNPKARSPTGAIGLMQIMPESANHIVKMYRIKEYNNSAQLLNPNTNIHIGTQYLEYVYQQFGQNRIFATAAYNAGPKRVRIWQKLSNGRLDAISFIESIPFSETRSYVKNVLAYDVYYRYLLNQSGNLLSEVERRSRY